MTTNLILAAQAAQGSGSSMSFIVMMVAIFAIMWFFMIRPQQKKLQKFQNSLTEGTSVVTGGGIYGIVKKIDLVANIIEVEIAKGVVIRVDKGYVFKDMASTPVQGK